MPRPGPRPYECVRRAWHSDRHQPIRGSLIQEIFRMVNEIHNPETQKNKEWQEKLPLVVLKAEEVMYSKANSEAEYMDLKTLWERTNDAIDTIIRRDDSPETEGDLLQPCIEAALNLGCIPRRASRSQRHSNPGCYLSSTSTREAAAATAASFLKITDINMFTNHLGTSRLPPTNSTMSQFESWSSSALATSPVDYTFEPKESISISKHHAFSVPAPSLLLHHGFEPKESTCPSFAHVYPLYYSDGQHPNMTAHLPLPERPSVCDAGVDFLHNFVCGKKARGASNSSSNTAEVSGNHPPPPPPPPPPRVVCDLSLRLGLSSPPLLDAESVWIHEVEDVASSSSCDGDKFSVPSTCGTRAANFETSFPYSKDKGYDFFPVDTTDEPLESCSSKWSSEGEGNATRVGGF